jgi:hypothetical protein
MKRDPDVPSWWKIAGLLIAIAAGAGVALFALWAYFMLTGPRM